MEHMGSYIVKNRQDDDNFTQSTTLGPAPHFVVGNNHTLKKKIHIHVYLDLPFVCKMSAFSPSKKTTKRQEILLYLESRRSRYI